MWRWSSPRWMVAVAAAAVALVSVEASAKATTTNGFMPAFQVVLDDPEEIDSMERALSLIEKYYPHESSSSPISHHAFVRMAPLDLQKEISKFVWNRRIIRQHFPNHKVYFDSFHEIYWMRPEFDLVDPKKIHYDGVIKVMFPFSTVRSLTYLKETTNPATLVALTSQRNFTTHQGTAIVIDFNRELHYADMGVASKTSEENPSCTSREPRIMIKAGIHVLPKKTNPLMAFLYIALHRGTFFAIKSVRNTFESSSAATQQQQKQQKPASSLALMALDNTMRALNKIHMALPLVAVGIPMGIFLTASIASFNVVLPYILHIALVWWRNIPPSRSAYLRYVATATSFAILHHLKKQGEFGFYMCVLQLAWIGACWYLEQSANMAHQILFAPIVAIS
ncbi:expressed unknown protein [Seminavis robusta]|uniref:Uncharacterized protein n=1 Tax=Seminavis robusta TaxID=568900 RepID=A0A9N8HHX7_9STRA|nr:expressed unknown protein [Seminavis robusta]|eukprot:Sro470_g149460.1 n/a (394) ;mRNA; f:13619-14800